ncbi:Concanavalin A-like lectin/glucanases superfamily protein, partial [Roseomonas rosea]
MATSLFDTVAGQDLPAFPGAPGHALAFAAATPSGGYKVQPGVEGALGSYTLVYDILLSADGANAFAGLLQVDPDNSDDGDLFVRQQGDTGGVGISSVYEGALSYGEWHRLAFTIQDQGEGTSLLSKYIDGKLVGTQEVDAARFTIDGAKGFLILADEDGETRSGALGGFLFEAEVMSAAEIAALGGTKAGGILPEAEAGPGATQFDFTAGDLSAGFGPGSMAPRAAAQAGEVGDLASLGLPPMPDTEEGVMRFPAADRAEGYLVKPGIEGAITTFTLVYDLQLDPDSMANYAGLLQTDLSNASDGDLFLRKTSDGAYGSGISGQYEGAATIGGWHRIGFTVTDQGGGNSLLAKYIDGELVGTQTVPTARFTLDGTNGFLILTDEDLETAGGFLAGFAFTDVALSADEMKDLGGMTPGGIFTAGDAPGNATQFDFEGGNFSASFGDGTMARRALDGTEFGEADELGAAPLPGSQNDGLLGFPATEPGEGYAINPGVSGAMASYTLIYDLLIPEGQEGSFGALLQAGEGDAELFLKLQADGSIGLGVAGQYDGAIEFGQWHRVAITVEAGEDGTAILRKFIDGTKVGEQSVEAARFGIDGAKGFMVLADEDGETWSGWLNSLHLTDRAMSEGEIADLGAAKAGGIIQAPPATGTATQFDFDNGDLSPTYGPGSMEEVGLSAGPSLVKGIADQRVTPAQESLEIDLSGVFEGEGLTYTVTTSDGRTVTGAEVVDGKLVLSLGGIGFDDVTVTATDSTGQSVSDEFRLRMAGENAYTIAILPDTQDYVFAGQGQAILNGMTQWLADNAATMDLRFVMSVGDVVASNGASQWAIAKDAFAKLNGVVPYSMLPGNHDQGSGGSANSYDSMQSDYFSLDYMKQHSTLGGVYDQEPDKTHNAWYSFEGADGTKWIVLALEFGARDDVLRWADEVLDAHSDHRAILTTHHYTNMGTRADNYSGPLFGEGTGKDYGIGGSAENANDGEDMWQGLISKHANVSFVFSGHVFGDGAETIVSYNEAGEPVYQMFVNYQNGVSLEVTGNGDPTQGGNGGNGAIRLVTIDPDTGAFYTETYLSAKGEYLTGSRGDPEPSRDGSGGDTGTPDVTIQPVTFGTAEGLGLPELPGGEAHVVSAPKFNPNNGIKVTPGFAPKDGGSTFDAYTLVYDLFLPQQDGLGVFFQSDLNNITDGDLWLNFRNGFALVGTNGQDEGNLPLDGWHRVVFTLERIGEGGSTFTLKKYVDGALQGAQTVGAVFNITEKGFLIFADDSGETPVFSLSSFAFVEKALSEQEVAQLGGPTASGPFSGPIEGVNAVQFDFTDGDFTPSFGTGTMSQTIGDSGGKQLTGSFLEHQETVEGVDLGAVQAQFRAKAGDDRLVSAGAEGEEALVTLDAGATVDPKHQVIGYEWLNADGEVIATTAQAQVSLGAGVHGLTLRVTDAEGTVSTDAVKVTVTDAGTLLHDDFNDGNATGWQSPGGNWQVAGSVQSREVQVGGIAAGTAVLRAYDGGAGIMAWQGEGSAAWSGYTVSATLLAEDQQGLGLVAYYKDAGNHYRLSFDIADNTHTLLKVQNGVATILAQEKGTTPFDRAMEVKLAVSDAKLLATLDGEALFGGVVTDAASPLSGGSVGLWSEGQRQVIFDDVMVQRGTLLADAGKTIRVIDTDGDGFADIDLSALSSFGADTADSIVWTEGGKVLANGAEASVKLGTGSHLVRLDLTDGEASSSDTVKVEVISAADILVRESFSAGVPQGWRFVDEGELGAAAKWSVKDGALVQEADRYSRELGGSGDTAPTAEWSLNWSPLGDGIHALRKGAYALYEGQGASEWKDYAVELDFTAPAGGGVGVLLHYKDANNYYKLEVDNQTGLPQLFSLKGGIEQTLWQGPARYDTGGTNHLRTEIVDGKLQAWLNGTALFTVPIEIHDTEQGSVGLYNWGNAGVSYDNLLVVNLGESLAPQPNPVNGTEGNDRLIGTDGADIIAGLGGDDRLLGGAGSDQMFGGLGDDGYMVDDAGDVVVELAGEGYDRVTARIDYVLGANVEKLMLEGAAVSGTGNALDNRILGTDGANILSGLDGEDALVGNGGNDQLLGGAGDDRLVGGAGADSMAGGLG